MNFKIETCIKLIGSDKLIGALCNEKDIMLCRKLFTDDISYLFYTENILINDSKSYPECEFRYIRVGWKYPNPLPKYCSLWNDLEKAKLFAKSDKTFDMGWRLFDIHKGETVDFNYPECGGILDIKDSSKNKKEIDIDYDDFVVKFPIKKD